MSTSQPYYFYVSTTTTGSYHVQNTAIDPRPQISANTIRIANNTNGTVVFRVDAPQALGEVTLEAFILDGKYVNSTACGVWGGKSIGTTIYTPNINGTADITVQIDSEQN